MDHETTSKVIYEDDMLDFEEDLGDVDLEDDLQALEIEDQEVVDDVEEGEISPTSGSQFRHCIGSSHVDCWRNKGGQSFEAADTYNGEQNPGESNLDKYKTGSFKSEGSVNGKPRRKKRRRRASVCHDVSRFVLNTCKRLREKKLHLMWEAVKKLGVSFMQDLVREVMAIEGCGGQLTADGSRRRTPGGVLWNVLKLRVSPEVYKQVMSRGNEVLKQKFSHSLKRRKETNDEHGGYKRQRINYSQKLPAAVPNRATQVVGSKSRKMSANKQSHISVAKNLMSDCKIHTPVLLQRAWAEGLKLKKNYVVEQMVSTHEKPILEAVASPKTSLGARIRAPVDYGDLLEDVSSFGS
ncbi:hypothetical protein O6H91_11G026900 [Diphasiastrum complanatum]|uniref:Uncharacterized protein n=2 Tax=Diphasiastrum complanatum TaxID=34168 RepID=A0ACC2C7E0_DIPCM|nr:hypothetical protein O6H91_11G026900 [Diphasiastrum complanatum]KAJ7537900.1 hypothetical protein O6H91_11G026900 [Diphasiastrum complanatum]